MGHITNLEAKFRTEAGSNPSNPVAGDMYYDTTNNRLMRYNGTFWSGIVFGISTSTSRTTSTSTSITVSTSTSITTTSTSTTSTSSSTTTISTSTTL